MLQCSYVVVYGGSRVGIYRMPIALSARQPQTDVAVPAATFEHRIRRSSLKI